MDAPPLPTSLVIEDLTASQRTLRVAMVTETYPPEVNGVATSMARLVHGLHARGHAVQLVRPRQHETEVGGAEPRLQEVLLRGLPIPRYPHLRLGLPARRTLLSLWSRQRPDIVHIATEGPLGWSALQAARQLRLAACSDFRTNFHAYSRHYGMGWLQRPIMAYLRKFHNRTLCTMVPTDSLRRELAACGFHNLRVVQRGVDTRLFGPARRSEALRRRWGAAGDEPVVLHVGRIAPEKNLETLAAACEAIRAAAPAARLVLVGDGPQREALARRLPTAHFAGVRTGEDLAAHYASADLFLFPSLTETFGNVTTEAMASGLAVLAYDYAAAGQLIRSGSNGLLAPFGDAAAFVRQAVALAADPARVRRLGARAPQAAAAMRWEAVLVQVEQIYRDALQARPGNPAAAGLQPAGEGG